MRFHLSKRDGTKAGDTQFVLHCIKSEKDKERRLIQTLYLEAVKEIHLHQRQDFASHS